MKRRRVLLHGEEGHDGVGGCGEVLQARARISVTMREPQEGKDGQACGAEGCGDALTTLGSLDNDRAEAITQSHDSNPRKQGITVQRDGMMMDHEEAALVEKEPRIGPVA